MTLQQYHICPQGVHRCVVPTKGVTDRYCDWWLGTRNIQLLMSSTYITIFWCLVWGFMYPRFVANLPTSQLTSKPPPPPHPVPPPHTPSLQLSSSGFYSSAWASQRPLVSTAVMLMRVWDGDPVSPLNYRLLQPSIHGLPSSSVHTNKDPTCTITT